MHKESHQYIDLVEVMRPITKWNARVNAPGDHPRGRPQGVQGRRVREAGRDAPRAARGRHGDGASTPSRCRAASHVKPEPGARELLRAADLIRNAINPVALAGNGVVRAGAAPALREFTRATGIAVAETFMGKGVLDYEDPKALGTVGLQSRDYAMAGFEDADVVIAIGYDLVEHAPQALEPAARTRRSSSSTRCPAEIDEYFQPEVELVGDIYHVLTRLAEECRDVPHSGGSQRLRDVVLGRFEAAKDDDHFPMQPPRALWEIRKALGREDILISDVGLHKLWIGRMFPAHEPNTVLIANGLAGMGFAVPCAIAAKLVHPERKRRHRQRRRRLPHERAGARDRDAAAARRWSTSSGRTSSTARSSGSRTRSSAATSASTSRTPTSSSSPRRSACRRWRCESVDDFGEHLRMGAGPRRPVADRAADRLLDRRRDLRGARNGDGA